MKVINECRVSYKYRLSSASPIISRTIYSNIVSTQIIKKVLEVTKYVNKETTFSFDILTYTIVIKNISSFDIEHILFQDDIPNNTKFIENTFMVDNTEIKCVNPQKGYLIEGLSVGKAIEIRFKVVVLPYNNYNEIMNYSTVSYKYKYNIEKEPILVRMDSNAVTTKREIKSFKQIQINESIYVVGKVCCIKNCDYDVDIIETKVIDNIERTSSTLLVIGRVKVKIYYEIDICNIYIERFVEDIFGFSTNIVVPIGINIVNTKNIEYDIENISINIVGENILFFNLSVLLHY